MENKKIGIIAGSLRRESYSLKIAQWIQEKNMEGIEFEIIDLYDLEIYNQDYDDDGQPAASWTHFRKNIGKMDGFIFVTPEYNRSIPAVLKNALDVGSRPYGKSVWNQKPAGIISQSPGAMGGFGANHHLRQVLVFLNVPVMPQPEAYLGGFANALDENGKIQDTALIKFLEDYLLAYQSWLSHF